MSEDVRMKLQINNITERTAAYRDKWCENTAYWKQGGNRIFDNNPTGRKHQFYEDTTIIKTTVDDGDDDDDDDDDNVIQRSYHYFGFF